LPLGFGFLNVSPPLAGAFEGEPGTGRFEGLLQVGDKTAVVGSPDAAYRLVEGEGAVCYPVASW
jgi:hypothetical protein